MAKQKQKLRISPPTKEAVERRLKLLEAELARLHAETGKPIGVLPYGLDAICGSFAGDPDFLEAMRLGAEWRASFRPKVRKKSGRKRGKNART
jgi:hypothetical protein